MRVRLAVVLAQNRPAIVDIKSLDATSFCGVDDWNDFCGVDDWNDTPKLGTGDEPVPMTRIPSPGDEG